MEKIMFAPGTRVKIKGTLLKGIIVAVLVMENYYRYNITYFNESGNRCDCWMETYEVDAEDNNNDMIMVKPLQIK
jgi:hypothetical protein